MTLTDNYPRDTPETIPAISGSRFKLPIRVTKSNVYYETFDYTTSFTKDNTEPKLDCQPTATLNIEDNDKTTITISLEGQLKAQNESLDFNLIQKMQINRHWESFAEIDPAIKKILYKDVMNSFASKYNLLFPKLQIKVVESDTTFHISQC